MFCLLTAGIGAAVNGPEGGASSPPRRLGWFDLGATTATRWTSSRWLGRHATTYADECRSTTSEDSLVAMS